MVSKNELISLESESTLNLANSLVLNSSLPCPIKVTFTFSLFFNLSGILYLFNSKIDSPSSLKK